MKVVYFGSDVFLPCFEYFVKNHEILALYTYHNDEDYFQEYSIVRRAGEFGIPVFYESVTQERIREYFGEQGCDLFFIAEYDRKVDVPEDLKEFKGINVHSSLLPQGRSYYPIECAMARELTETGVTLHKITNALDCGDIIAQGKVTITPKVDSLDVYMTNAANAQKLLTGIMDDFEKAWNSAQPQKEVIPYWKRPKDELLTITHEMTVQEALEVFRRYNGMTELLLEGKVNFVYAMMPGSAMLFRQEIQLREGMWLFGLKDGHIRINVTCKNQKNRI